MSKKNIFEGKTVVLGVTGSVAAYKAADLASRLVKEGAEAYPVMTKEAARLIAPLTLQTVSRHAVAADMWEEGPAWRPDHISLADRADLLLVAPATAHIMACFTHGLAPDLLTAVYLATKAPVLIAPAMNVKMWEHPATRANTAALVKRGARLIGPAEGMLACGYEGKGRLLPVDEIIGAAREVLEGAAG